MDALHLYNTLSGKKEKFEAIKPPFVGLYVCGPTVYSNVHLGNCRTFISFDLINRYLRYLGYQVRYVRNITDAGHLENDAEVGEDKISKKARLESLEPMQIVQTYSIDFRDKMEVFNTLPPDIEPTATGHIVEQIDIIKDIMDKGLAYEINGSVYFDVLKYSETDNYGILSGRKIDELLSGSRALDGQDEKKNAVDFALWKKASPSHIMRWNSPWGEGFPGWHLECSVMSTKYLGESFDIHGGGMDLKFPHHECEIAQNKAANGTHAVKYWLHGNMLTFEGTKMSKSLGNSILPNELFSGDHKLLNKGFDPMVVRFFMLQAHYRSTLDFSNEALEASEKGFQRLMAAFETLHSLDVSDTSDIDSDSYTSLFEGAMNDDFNSPILISHMFDLVKAINSVADGRMTINQATKDGLTELMQHFVVDILGLTRSKQGDGAALIDGLMDVIIDVRNRSRLNKDWATSDAIRDQLKDLNIVVKDGKDGAKWEAQ